MQEEAKFRNLRLWNIAMCILHFIQGVAILILSNDFSVPVTTAYLKFNPAIQQLAPQLNTVTEIRLGPLVATFFFLSALAHFLVSLPGIFDWYKANLKKGANYARWMEYSLSSSLMIVIVSFLVGVYDLSSLILIFFLNMMMILFGWMMELHNQTTEKTNWTSYIFGCIAGVIPWVVIALYLFGSGDGDNKAPTFVYYIFLSIFIFFNIFALNMYLQYKKIGPWKDYLFGEKMYLILSLVAKSLLAWQVFAGTLRPV
jgi:hypothetical protein